MVLNSLNRTWFTAISAVIFLLIIFPLFIPFTPKMPAQGVDPSWALGLNEAVAQGLAFGKSIIFTLGPYSSIYTKFYHPATDSMMLWGSTYLACAYCFALLCLMKQASWQWGVILASFLLTLIYAKDALFFSYPLLLGLLVFNQLDQGKKVLINELIVYAFLFSALGLLPLIKGSLLILSGSLVFLCSLIFCFHRQVIVSFFILFSFISALFLFWILAGQDLVNICAYIKTSCELAFCFTEAMSIQGNVWEIICYLVVSLLILFFTSQQSDSKSLRLFLALVFFLFLFLSFKAAFIRHFGHAFIAGTSLLLAAILLPYCTRSKYLLPIMGCAFIASFYIEGHYRHIDLFKNIQSTYSTAFYGITNRINTKDWLKNNFFLVSNFLKTKNNLPVLNGKTDIYSYEQTDLIASENHWTPRPIIQSYSVFDAHLAKINAQHLLGDTRPDNLFFKLQAIDNRWPSLEDGLSWPIFLKNYYLSTWVNDYVLLLKTKNSSSSSLKQVTQQQAYLGEVVQIPKTKKLIFIRVDLNPSSLGRIMNFLFKLPELKIIAQLNNGVEKQYRFIPSMASSAFLLSPLVETTQEFAALYQNEKSLDNKRLSSFKIMASNDSGTSLLWEEFYKVQFKVMD